MGRFPDYEPSRDGNVFRWLRDAAARVRAERQAAAIMRQRARTERMERDYQAMREADALLEQREAADLSERRMREREARKATKAVSQPK